MSPPRVGRLTFQVGSRATQVITIDLGDFGKGGPITNDVTGDVDESLDNMNNRINSREMQREFWRDSIQLWIK